MNKILITILVLILVLGLQSAWAVDPGTTGAAFLKVGLGAKAEGMGEAFTAVADDIDTISWNAAGLGRLSQVELSFIHQKIEDDVAMEHIAYVQPLGDMGTLGASFDYLWMAGLQITSAASPDGTGANFTAYDALLTLAYGTSLGSEQSVGGAAKYIQRALGSFTVSGFAVDLGYLYRPEFFRTLQFGVSVQNLGTSMTFISSAEQLPTDVRTGLSMLLYKDDLNSLTVAMDYVLPNDDQSYADFGAEFWLQNTLAFRGGYQARQDVPSITAGVGFWPFKTKDSRAGLDYSITYQRQNDLPAISRLSLKAKF